MAVTKHHDVIAEPHHVSEDMADVDDGDTLQPQAVDGVKKPAGFARCQGGCGFIEYDHLCLRAKRLGDFHKLALALRELVDQRRRRKIEIDGRQKLRRLPAGGGTVDEGQPGNQLGELGDEQVLGDAQIAEQVQFLMDEGNALPRRVTRTLGPVVSAVELDMACVHLVYATDDVHRRGLARAVLADEAQHAARPQRETDIVQDLDAEEALAESFAPEQGKARGGGCRL